MNALSFTGLILITPAKMALLIPGLVLLFLASILLFAGVRKPDAVLKLGKKRSPEKALLIFGSVCALVLIYVCILGVSSILHINQSLSSISSTHINFILGTHRNGVYTSIDGGKTWSQSLKGKPLTELAFYPNSGGGSTVFAGTGGDGPPPGGGSGIYRSYDSGQTWNQVNYGLTSEDIYSLAVSPNFKDDSTVFAGSYCDESYDDYYESYVYTCNGIFKSTNGGANWEPADGGLTDRHVYELVISPSFASDQTLFADTGDGVFKSVNGGEKWLQVSGFNDEDIGSLDISPNFASDQTIFAITENKVYKSINQGIKWNILSLPNDISGLKTLAISPRFANDQTLFGNTDHGIFKSVDGGGNWSRVKDFNDEKIDSIVISPNFAIDQTIFAITKNKVYESTDQGISWSILSLPSDVSGITSLSLLIRHDTNQTLYAGTLGSWNKSTDNGLNWTSSNNVPFLGLTISFVIITLFGAGCLGYNSIYVIKKRKALKLAIAEVINLSHNLSNAPEIAHRTGCKEAEAAMFVGFVSDHKNLVAKLSDLKIEAEKLKNADTSTFCDSVDKKQDYLTKLMHDFSAGNAKSAIDGLNKIEPTAGQLATKLQRLNADDEEIGRRLVDSTAKLGNIRQMATEARTGLADLSEIDLTDEFSQLDEVEKELRQAETALQKGIMVKLPDGDRISKIMASGDEKVQTLASLKTDLPEFTRQVSNLLTEISEAMKGAAPLESEKQTTKQLLGTVKQINEQMAAKKLLPARKALNDARDELERLAAQVEHKAALPQLFEDSIENRISILLESWKMVTPDMLTELDDDSREWALVHYFERHKDEEAILLRGTSLVTADAGDGGNMAPPPAPLYDSDAPSPQKATPVSRGSTRLCSNCKSPLDEGQKHCGRCGTMVII